MTTTYAIISKIKQLEILTVHSKIEIKWKFDFFNYDSGFHDLYATNDPKVTCIKHL